MEHDRIGRVANDMGVNGRPAMRWGCWRSWAALERRPARPVRRGARLLDRLYSTLDVECRPRRKSLGGVGTRWALRSLSQFLAAKKAGVSGVNYSSEHYQIVFVTLGLFSG
jgi:hypothetical protein